LSLYRDTRGSGPDVALLHGWALHGGVFDGFGGDLATRHRVHTLDLPGHGRSPWAKGCADLEGVARHVAEHVPERCALVGWSFGGMVAIRIATLFPERVSALVLIASTPCFSQRRDWPHGMDEAALTTMARGLARDWQGTISDFLSLQVRGDSEQLQTLRELKRLLIEHGAPSSAALTAGLAILRGVDLRDELARVHAPTLVLGGALDRLTPPGAAAALAAGIVGARALSIAHAAHAPFLSHRALVSPPVLDFLGAPP
jgi:pimeloyl-[acyl-carrier protein] methyl ester esterase